MKNQPVAKADRLLSLEERSAWEKRREQRLLDYQNGLRKGLAEAKRRGVPLHEIIPVH